MGYRLPSRRLIVYIAENAERRKKVHLQPARMFCLNEVTTGLCFRVQSECLSDHSKEMMKDMD
jgi:hypothetical protein